MRALLLVVPLLGLGACGDRAVPREANSGTLASPSSSSSAETLVPETLVPVTTSAPPETSSPLGETPNGVLEGVLVLPATLAGFEVIEGPTQRSAFDDGMHHTYVRYGDRSTGADYTVGVLWGDLVIAALADPDSEGYFDSGRLVDDAVVFERMVDMGDGVRSIEFAWQLSDTHVASVVSARLSEASLWNIVESVGDAQ